MAKRIFFARYQEQELIGEGGIGQVFRVCDLWEEREKALKILKPEFLNTGVANSFLQEFELLRNIAHPHILPVFDYHSDIASQNRAYTAELLGGSGLLQWSFADPASRHQIACQMCQILEFIHLQGIIHCDLKPDNFKVISDPGKSPRPWLKLLDFGLAESVELIKENRVKGTLAYMAPEVLKTQSYTKAADLYSLGVILYQLYTGQLPFQANDPAVLISKILEEEPVPPASLEGSISPELEKLILALLRKDPAKRIASAAGVKEYFVKASSKVDSADPGLSQEWLPLLESGGWVPPQPLGQELIDNLIVSANERKKLTILCGAPGVGKTRLLKELNHFCHKRDLPCLYWSAFGGIKENLGKLTGVLKTICSHSDEPALQGGRNIIEELESAEDFNPKLKFLSRLLNQLPFIFFIDEVDFQSDLEFIRELCQSSATQKSQIFLALQPFPAQVGQLEEFIHSHPETEKVEIISLSPMNLEETEKLRENKLPGLQAGQKLSTRLWKVSGGNPGLLMGYLRRLWEEEELTLQAGEPKFTKKKASSQAQEKTLAPYADFVNAGLTSEQKEFLRIVSVIGEKFDLYAAVHLTGRKLEDCFQSLRIFLKEKVLLADPSSPSGEYYFSPPGLRELYYFQNTIFTREDLHLKVGQYLEEQKEGGQNIPPGLLAYHFVHSPDHRRAYDYSLQAAEEALKILSKFEVLHHLKNALDSAKELSESEERVLKMGQVLRKRAHFWKTVGNFHRALSDYRRLLKLFPKNSRDKTVAEAYKDLGDLYRLKNNYRRGMVFLRRAEEVYRALGEKTQLAHTLNNIGNLYWISLDYPKALEYLRAALDLHQTLGNLAGAGSSLNNLAGVYLAQNQYSQSIEYYRRSLEIQRQMQVPEEISRVLNNLGVVFMYTANYHKALESLSESLKINQETGNLREQIFNLENLGECYHKLGQETQALQYSQLGLNLAEEIGFTLRKGRIQRNSGKSKFALGEFSLALDYYQRALETAKYIEDWETQVWVLLDLAEFYLNLNQLQLCAAKLGEVTPLLDKLDESRARVSCHFIRGRLWQAQARPEEARQELLRGEVIAREKNLLEEELAAALLLADLDLEQNHMEALDGHLELLQKLFEKGDFSRFQASFCRLRTAYRPKSGDLNQALDLAQSGLKKAQHDQNWEEAVFLSYLTGQVKWEKKDYEGAYMAWQEGVSQLKRLYQNISQPELKDSYLHKSPHRELLTKFKEIATFLAGTV